MNSDITPEQIQKVSALIRQYEAAGNSAAANTVRQKFTELAGGFDAAKTLVTQAKESLGLKGAEKPDTSAGWAAPDPLPAGVSEESRPGSDYWTAMLTGAKEGYKELARGLERATYAGGGGDASGLTFADPVGAAAAAAATPATPEDLQGIKARQAGARIADVAARPPAAVDLPGYRAVGSSLGTAPAYMLPGRMQTLPAQMALSAVEGGLREDQSVLGNVVGTAAGHLAARAALSPFSRKIDQGKIGEYAALQTAPRSDLPPMNFDPLHWQLQDPFRVKVKGTKIGDPTRRVAATNALRESGYRGAADKVPLRVRSMIQRGDWVPPGFRTGDPKQIDIDRAMYRNIDTSAIPLSRMNQNQYNLNASAGQLAGLDSPPTFFDRKALDTHVQGLQTVKDRLIQQAPAQMAESDADALLALQRNLKETEAYTGMDPVFSQVKKRVFYNQPGSNTAVFRQPDSSWVHAMRQKIKKQVDGATGADETQGRKILNRFDEIFERGLTGAELAQFKKARTNQYWTLNLLEKGGLDDKGNVIPKFMRDKFYQPSGQAHLYDQKMVDRANALSPGAYDRFDDLTWLGAELAKPPKLSTSQRLGHWVNPFKGKHWAIDPGDLDPVKQMPRRGDPTRLALYAAGYPQMSGYLGLPHATPDVLAPAGGALGRAGFEGAYEIADPYIQSLDEKVRGILGP